MKNDDDDVMPEYDFGHASQGKHYREFWAEHGLVALDDDLKKEFPSSEAVNEALRALLRIRRESRAG